MSGEGWDEAQDVPGTSPEVVGGHVVAASTGPQTGLLVSHVAARLGVSPKRVRNLVASGDLDVVEDSAPVRLTVDSVEALERRRTERARTHKDGGQTWGDLAAGPVSPYVELRSLVLEACERIALLADSQAAVIRSQERLAHEVAEAFAPRPRAVTSGQRRPTTTVRRDDIAAALRSLSRHYTTAEMADAMRAMDPEAFVRASLLMVADDVAEERDGSESHHRN